MFAYTEVGGRRGGVAHIQGGNDVKLVSKRVNKPKYCINDAPIFTSKST